MSAVLLLFTGSSTEERIVSAGSGVIWSAILTGTADGVTDLDLKLLNIQATLRFSTASFLQVIVPLSQLDDVLARENGAIVVYKTILPDGDETEFYRVNFSEMRSDYGARSSKLTLSGRSEAAFSSPALVTISEVVSDDLQASGARSLAVSPFNNVFPGDTVTYDSVSTVVEIVEVSSSSTGTNMRLAEA